ncbi:MAG: hypothetical protein ABEJ35_00975 [Halobacteriaceae archaeon]
MATETREATPEEAGAIAELLSLPEAAAQRLLRARTVEVAFEDGSAIGCLAYEIHDGAVRVTALGGRTAAIQALLEAPRRLGAAEDLPVVVLVPDGEAEIATAIETAGFEAAGEGPAFRGRPTTTYRRAPPSSGQPQ